MKKLLILLIYTWFCHAAALADVGKSPERTVENVADGVIVTYKFNDPIIRPNHLAPGSYLWEYMGFGINDTSGEPAIPFRSDIIYVPAGYKGQVTLLDSTYRDTTFVLSPAIPPVPNNGLTIVTIDSITPYTGFYPNSVLKYGPSSKYREVGLQNVIIIPIKYNYTQHKVRAYSEIKYKVTFVQDGARSGSKGNSSGNMSDLTSTFLSNTTLNYTPTNTRSDSIWHSIRNEPNYLIITTNEYYNVIHDFVKWKRMKGNNVDVEKLPKGSWNPNNIRFAVELHNDPLNPLDYVLIIGGHDDVPGVPFEISHPDGPYYGVTDYTYGLLNADNIPQVHRGRIFGDTTTEITSVLDKIIQYERNPTMNESFYKTALHCSAYIDRNAGYDVEDGCEDRAFILTSENIRNYLTQKDYTIHRQYGKRASITPFHWSNSYSDGRTLPAELQPDSYLWNGNADSIRNIINNGAFYVLYKGHGETDFWCDPPFGYYNISQLQNENMFPVIFSSACSTGEYDTNYNCLAESFLKKTNGGCVGIIAASSVAFSGWDDAMVLGMIDAIWPNLQLTYVENYSPNINDSIPVYELGQILDIGLLRMKETYGYGGRIMETRKAYHFFGDPSMQIYTEKPNHFAEPSVFLRGDSLFVFVEDGDCKITFYNKITKNIKSYKGNYAAYANPTDSLVICLDRHNYVPYIWDYEKNLYIQNEDIQNETRVYKGNSIYVGNNVTSTKPTGDVNIQNSHITIQGKHLELRPRTRIDKNFKFQNR